MRKITIVNKDDKVIGYKEFNNCTYDDIYRVSALWVINSQKEILLTKRSITKSHDPQKWQTAVAGTVEKGETYRENILKEAEEEIGVKNIKLVNGPKVKFEGTYTFWAQWYVCVIDKEIDEFRIQKDEVESIKWFTEEEIRKLIKNSPTSFVQGFEDAFEMISEYMKSFGSNMNKNSDINQEGVAKRYFHYDLMRFIAIVAVVANHTLTKFAETALEKGVSFYLNEILKFAVPLFLFLSGYFFSKDREWKYIRNKIKKVLKPYTFFFILSILYYVTVKDLDISNPLMLLASYIFGRGFGHFFVFLILVLYLTAFWLTRKYKSREQMLMIFFISLFVQLLWLSIDSKVYQFLNLSNFRILDYHMEYFIFYRNIITWLPFFIGGICYQNVQVRKFVNRNKLIVILFFLLIFVLYTLQLVFKVGDYKGYGSISWSLFSFSLIFMLLVIPVEWVKWKNKITYVSKISLYIYFIHYFVVNMFVYIDQEYSVNFSYIFSLILFIVAFLFSIFIISGSSYIKQKHC